MKKILFISAFFFWQQAPLISQLDSLNNKRIHQVIIKNDTNFYSDLTIDPSSFKLSSRLNMRKYYDYYLNNRSIHILLKDDVLLEKADTLDVFYRIFPYDLGKNYSGIDSSGADFRDKVIYVSKNDLSNGDLDKIIESEQLNYSGSFSRGISFGNTQDLILNSNLNLQMKGDLGNGLLIKAAISDESIPIQAQGNTQLLQEFDKVFVEIEKDNTKLIAGDYELSSPNNHFVRYFKKLQGLSILNESKSGKNKFHTKASYAVSRGKFDRVNLATSEGNQGPYKLTQDASSRFIIVLSGTEKVYLDGELLQRGLDNDYIIDYNRAEISFTTNRLITKDTRIIVEFEFTDQNYSRSLYAVDSKLQSKKWEFAVSLYNEQDSKTSTGILELDSIALNALQNSGDNLELSTRPGITATNTSISPQPVYRYVFESGIQDSILVYDPIYIGDGYNAIFTDLGDNNGSYNIDGSQGLNTRVYKFVGPGLGRYEPRIQLIPPERKQLHTAGLRYHLSERGSLGAELAISHLDLNSFSEIDNEDNDGTALFLDFNELLNFGKEGKLNVLTEASFERRSRDFNHLNPYRSAEFSRDWNFFSQGQSTENIFQIGISPQLLDFGKLSYQFESFTSEGLYSGQKNLLNSSINKNGWKFTGTGNWLNAENNTEQINFVRPRLILSKSIWEDKLEIGLDYNQERNEISNLSTNELDARSFDFKIYKAFIEAKPVESLLFGFSVLNRNDLAANNNVLGQATDAYEYGTYGKWTESNSKLNWRIVYRSLNITNDQLSNEKANNTLLARIDHNLNLFNRGIILNTIVESNTGQEAKLEEQFIEVQKGEGRYIWIDNAPADSIQQINEFVIAPFADQGNYEKVSLFNNEFVAISKSIFNQTLKIDGARLVNADTEKNILKLARKLSWNTRFRIDQKIEDDNRTDGGFELLNFDFDDERIVSYNGAFDNSLFFNKGNPNFDISMGNRQLRNKVLLITGYEQRKFTENYIRARVNVKKKNDLLLEMGFGKSESDSEFFDNNDFEIAFFNLRPSISYRPNPKLRISSNYKFTSKENQLPGREERSEAHELGLEFNWRNAGNSFLQSRASLVNISFNGEENSQLELELLDGLKTGVNYLWGLNFTKRLNTTVDMIISYEGRKTGSSNVVHVFSTQVKASF